ncbi:MULTISPECIES: trigger factor [Marinimicrobium]|jgi:trigger factor|uniref:Trigger factor n=1 Tax=Marinimicrobium koreense TaxID=306545 RepID=A0A3N1NVM8_9GAMM|nr:MULTISPECIES: trigger factor [Marinimicrobium]MAN51983.1 trigger factor [Marinimicrobium sp.]ROQ20213.1 trigger factor [Marinimicrobium koreense]
MQVSIETTSGLERRLTVGVPAAEVDSEVQKRLQQAAKNIRINGFRKGKVPMKVVKQRYGDGVRQEVLGDVINRSFYEAVRKEDVKPAGQPSIEPKQFEEGKDLEYVATFEVYPSVELGDFSKIEVTRYKADVTAEDVDNMIDVLREHQASWKEVDRAAQDGDQVNIDFVGTRDGEAFEGGSAEGQNLVLGSGSMIPGFEDGLVGLKAGDEKTLELTFPEDYQAEELRGAAVEFKVTVNSVSEKELPELDKDFYAKFGVEKGGKPQFRKEVKANMARELKNAIKAKTKNQVMDALLETHKPDLPKALVSSEIETLRQQMMQRFGGQQQNFDVKSLLPDTMFQEDAERRVALGLVVGEIVKENQIKVDADRVREMVEELASTYEEPEAVVNYYYENRQLLSSVESAALEDQVVDFILDKAKVTDESSSYDDIVTRQKQQ